jgi:hypothetical protein
MLETKSSLRQDPSNEEDQMKDFEDYLESTDDIETMNRTERILRRPSFVVGAGPTKVLSSLDVYNSGGTYTFQVPSGVILLKVFLVGADGFTRTYQTTTIREGGRGAIIESSVTVEPGQIYQLNVADNYCKATDLRCSPYGLNDRIVVAGAGGAASDSQYCTSTTGSYLGQGGNAGWPAGSSGKGCTSTTNYYGRGGSQNAGGSSPMLWGSFGAGGGGFNGGGQGGSGWYGGGGGDMNGGGGGSSYSAFDITLTSVNSGVFGPFGFAKLEYFTVAPTRAPSREPTINPTKAPTAQPTSGPSSQPTGQPRSRPSSQPSRQPSRQPTCQPSRQPSTQPTGQPTCKPSSQPTSQPSQQPTSQPSRQPSTQPTGQPTCIPSSQPTSQPSRQPTGQPISAPTCQPTGQPSKQPTAQPNSAPTCQPTTQPSCQPSSQPSAAPTLHPTGQPTRQPTAAPSCHPTAQPSAQPSGYPTRQPTALPSVQPSCQPTGEPSSQPSSHPSAVPSMQPSLQPTMQPTGVPSTQPSGQPTGEPSAQPSGSPTVQPSSQPTGEPTSQPSSKPTSEPTNQPSASPSIQPTVRPSAQPTGEPSSQPSVIPSSQPSTIPSKQPTGLPSRQPSVQPTAHPTAQPSVQPSRRPSSQPSSQPSVRPSIQPSAAPSNQPSALPSNQPSAQPTDQPSVQPVAYPTTQPSAQPSSQPSRQPVAFPTSLPTCQPSSVPTMQPSMQPSRSPTAQPSEQPTRQPSSQPSAVPTTEPTSRPSCAPFNGEWALQIVNGSRMDGVAVVEDYLVGVGSVQGKQPSSVFVVDSLSGVQVGEYSVPWEKVIGVIYPGSVGGGRMSAGVLRLGLEDELSRKELLASSVAALTQPFIVSGTNKKPLASAHAFCELLSGGSMSCSVQTFANVTLLGATWNQYSSKLVSVCDYFVRPMVFVMSSAGGVVWVMTYTTSAFRSLSFKVVASTAGYVGSFVAGPAVSSGASAKISIVAGWLHTDLSSVNGFMSMTPVNDAIVTIERVTQNLLVDPDSLDSIVVGNIVLRSAETISNAYLLRFNSVIRFMMYGMQYRPIEPTEDQSAGKALVLVDSFIYLICDVIALHSNITSLSLLKLNAESGTIIKQMQVYGPSSITCSDITVNNGLLAIACGTWAEGTWKPLMFSADYDLSFRKLLPGYHRSATIKLQALSVAFQATTISLAQGTGNNKANSSTFVTNTNFVQRSGSIPSRKPSTAPTRNPTGTPAPTAVPTLFPTKVPSCSPSVVGTLSPSQAPSSANPTLPPSPTPSILQQSATPTSQPTGQPSRQPSSSPTAGPTVSPAPTATPSTTSPTTSHRPTGFPSSQPSAQPSAQPVTMQPSETPTPEPTSSPSENPSADPSGHPSSQPSGEPSSQPSSCPSSQPSHQPTVQPSQQPSRQPISAPSAQPSAHPTAQPSSSLSSEPTVSQPLGDGTSSGKVSSGYVVPVICSVAGAMAVVLCLLYYRYHRAGTGGGIGKKNSGKVFTSVVPEGVMLSDLTELEAAQNKKHSKSTTAGVGTSVGADAGAGVGVGVSDSHIGIPLIVVPAATSAVKPQDATRIAFLIKTAGILSDSSGISSANSSVISDFNESVAIEYGVIGGHEEEKDEIDNVSEDSVLLSRSDSLASGLGSESTEDESPGTIVSRRPAMAMEETEKGSGVVVGTRGNNILAEWSAAILSDTSDDEDVDGDDRGQDSEGGYVDTNFHGSSIDGMCISMNGSRMGFRQDTVRRESGTDDSLLSNDSDDSIYST